MMSFRARGASMTKAGSAGGPPANNNVQIPQSVDFSSKGWHSRGYISHFDCNEIPQFITFRLADSLPAVLLNEWKARLKYLSETESEIELRNRIEEHLDRGTGNAWLKKPDIAEIVEGALLHFDGRRFRLHSWVIMPNHIHILITPMIGHGVSEIVHAIKSFTAKEANRLLGRNGKFWQADYYDRYIRDERHYYKTVEYIEMNPVKAGLCDNKEQWEFGSAASMKRAGGTPALPAR